jgi:hypothetical protein
MWRSNLRSSEPAGAAFADELLAAEPGEDGVIDPVNAIAAVPDPTMAAAAAPATMSLRYMDPPVVGIDDTDHPAPRGSARGQGIVRIVFGRVRPTGHTGRTMNDLAEQALHGLDLARKKIVEHPVTSLAVAGFVAAGTAMVAGGRIGAGSATTPLTHWLGLLPDDGTRNDALAGGIMFGAICCLLLLWIVAVAVVRSGSHNTRQAWSLVAAWGVPFAVGPPLLSTDIYNYAAQGLLQRAGKDPYSTGPSSLGYHAIVNAIDPTWRGAPSTSGPLGTLVQHLAVASTGGDAVATVIVLRLLAIACVICIGLLAADLAGPYRVPAIVLTALNPALLLYLLSGAHLDGALALLVLAALVTSAQRRWTLSVVLICAAAAVKPVALAVVPAVLLAHCLGHRAHIAWRIIARDLAIAAVTLAALTLIVRDGLGWRRNLSVVTREHTPFAPASIVSDIVRPIVPSASFDDLAVGGRIAVVVAAVALVAYLLATVRERSLDRTVGFALLAVALLGPVLYPWYLLGGLVCLAPTATGARRDWVVALSCAACVLAPAGFGTDAARTVTLVALIVIAIALLPVLYAHQQRRRLALR